MKTLFRKERTDRKVGVRHRSRRSGHVSDFCLRVIYRRLDCLLMVSKLGVDDETEQVKGVKKKT